MQGQAQAEAKAKEHTITIEGTGSNLSYKDQNGNPARVKRAKRLESIGWQSKDKEEFIIDDFKEKETGTSAWPFEGKPETLESKGGEVPPLTVSDQAKLKISYKYTVRKPPSGPPDDPEIIIDPSE